MKKDLGVIGKPRGVQLAKGGEVIAKIALTWQASARKKGKGLQYLQARETKGDQITIHRPLPPHFTLLSFTHQFKNLVFNRRRLKPINSSDILSLILSLATMSPATSNSSAFSQLQVDALSRVAVNGSVCSLFVNQPQTPPPLSTNTSPNRSEDSCFKLQNAVEVAALSSQRLNDFMADAHVPPTYTRGRGASVVDAERLMTLAMEDFDRDFERASQ